MIELWFVKSLKKFFHMSVVDNIELKPRERVLKEVRRFPLVYAGHYVIATIIMLLPFFFLFPLMKLRAWGVGIGGACLFFGLYHLIKTTYLWYHNVFVITTERIIDFDQRGFFERVVSQSSWEKVQDVSFHINGAFQVFFRYGDVNIKSAWGSVDLCVPSVFRPSKIQRLMLDAQEQYLLRHGHKRYEGNNQ